MEKRNFMPKLLFIYNPHSGTGKIRPNLSDVIEIFAEKGYETTVYPTQCQGDCTRRVISAADEGFERIVVSGGDGMLHEMTAAAADLKTQTILGYIPTGTVNDFAASHCIPLKIKEAAENAVGGSACSIDVMRFNDTYFSYVAAFGLFTNVSYQTDQKTKNQLGSFAYFLEGLKSITPAHFGEISRVMKITANGEEISGEFVFGAITNSTSLGSIKNFFPQDVKLDDGIIEGIFIKRPKTFLEFDRLYRALITKSLNSPCIMTVKASEFHLEAEREMAWTLDGENGGSHGNVKIEAIPQAIKIALPNI